MTEDANDAVVVADLARQAAGVQETKVDPDATRLLLVREAVRYDGNKGEREPCVADRVRVLSLEQWATRPERLRGSVEFDEAASFASYVNEFKASPATRLYASLKERRVDAVLNDDDPGLEDAPQGAWRDHRAALLVRATPEWARWREHDGAQMSQTEFAEHLEINLADIVQPAAADLVEIARSFTASTDVQFRSAVNLQSGETRFAYDEDTRATATNTGGSTIDVPRTFTLLIAPFQGMDKIEVTVRLRYRLQSGRLSLGYLVNLADDVEREAFKAAVEGVAEATGIDALYGRAPSHRYAISDGSGDVIA